LGRTFKTVNPKTEEVIADVQEADKADVDLAVAGKSLFIRRIAFSRRLRVIIGAAARRAFPGFSGLSGVARRDLLNKLADLIHRDAAKLAEIESADNGKTVAIAQNVDIALVVKCLRYYAGFADKITGKTVPVENTGYFVFTKREPVGVVGQIIPWNFPLLMMAWKIAPALATGCTIVLKTSEKTPLSALLIAKLIEEAGYAPGVVNVLSGYGPTAGEAIARHMDVDKIAFTGKTHAHSHSLGRPCPPACTRTHTQIHPHRERDRGP
jgi:aldehyde dehydrogenase (NAD+)